MTDGTVNGSSPQRDRPRCRSAKIDGSIGFVDDTTSGPALRIKIGVSVGEPVEQDRDLFGASVNLAARICAHAKGRQILAAGAVRDLAIGKEFRWVALGSTSLKGFPDRIPLYEIDWRTSES